MADVGCAGILVADTFCGPMSALPKEGELLAIGPFRRRVGGCAANVALDLKKQGVSVELAGCMGHDTAGEILVGLLQQSGIGCQRVVRTDDYSTSETIILLVAGQDRRYIHVFGANTKFSEAHIDPDWATSLKVLYIGGLLALPGIDLSALAGLLSLCRKHGVITVLDVVIPQPIEDHDSLDSVLRQTDYFLPNDDEAKAITGESDPFDQLRALLSIGVRTAIVTLGGDGVVAAHEDKLWRLGAYSTEVVDPSGAGDAFCSGVITGLVRGWDMPQTLRYASALGASATQAVGTTDGVLDGASAQRLLETCKLTVMEDRLAFRNGILCP